jgi:hypothetical protein
MVHPIPDAVSFEDGAMMEPLSVGVHSVANLGEFKSDQVSEASAQPISTGMLISGLYRFRRWTSWSPLYGSSQGTWC